MLYSLGKTLYSLQQVSGEMVLVKTAEALEPEPIAPPKKKRLPKRGALSPMESQLNAHLNFYREMLRNAPPDSKPTQEAEGPSPETE